MGNSDNKVDFQNMTVLCLSQHSGQYAASPSAYALCLGRHGKLKGETTCGFYPTLGVKEVWLKRKKNFLLKVRAQKFKKRKKTWFQEGPRKVSSSNAWFHSRVSLVRLGLLWAATHDAGDDGTMQWMESDLSGYMCSHRYRRPTISSCNGNMTSGEQTFNVNHHTVNVIKRH